MYICYENELFMFFFFKQKTAYEMRISDWSSDVCSSDLPNPGIEHVIWEVRQAILQPPLNLHGRPAEMESFEIGVLIFVERQQSHHETRVKHAITKIGRASCRERVCQYV